MKKLTVMLVIVAMMFSVMPTKVMAASFVKDGDLYKVDSDVSAGRYGTFKQGDITYRYTDEAGGIKTWSFYLTPSRDLDYVYLDLVPVSLEIQSVRAGDQFTKISTSNDSILLEVKNSGSVKSGTRVLLFTVVTKDTSDSGCTLSTSPKTIGTCTVIDGNYFDKDGKKVTEEAYKASCEGSPEVPVTPPDTPNPIPPTPETGSVVPYIAIGGGLLAIAGVYVYSKKSNKMYKL